MLTGIRDVDREIVNNLNDKDLLNMCIVNRTYSERVCDDSYFRLRTEARFPETVPYKDYINENKTRTWKNHYLTIVKYIDLLQRRYKYIYRAEDKSPELSYLVRQIVPGFYNKKYALIKASKKGNLPLVKYLVDTGDYINIEYNRALKYASQKGKLSVVKYLVEIGADVTAEDNIALQSASENGHLIVVKYLVEHGADITARNNIALLYASFFGYLELVKYLVENGADITIQDNYAVRYASSKGYLSVVKYLVENGADITAQNNYAVRLASENGHSEVVKYLTSLE